MNLDIKGQEKSVADMIISVDSFWEKLRLFVLQFRGKELKHLQNMKEELQSQENLQLHSDKSEKYRNIFVYCT